MLIRNDFFKGVKLIDCRSFLGARSKLAQLNVPLTRIFLCLKISHWSLRNFILKLLPLYIERGVSKSILFSIIGSSEVCACHLLVKCPPIFTMLSPEEFDFQLERIVVVLLEHDEVEGRNEDGEGGDDE